ncbi:hypothetical protein QTP86_001079 [Hemibagrus guttatus]|nr:hypothetical protein QTP86_001079 [Hemibagrus guttatus]
MGSWAEHECTECWSQFHIFSIVVSKGLWVIMATQRQQCILGMSSLSLPPPSLGLLMSLLSGALHACRFAFPTVLLDDRRLCRTACRVVRFHDCGRGGRVHFECSRPTDFRIEITGDVLSLRTLQPSLSSPSSFSSTPLLVMARDISTQEQWQTEIRLQPSGGHETQLPGLVMCHKTLTFTPY